MNKEKILHELRELKKYDSLQKNGTLNIISKITSLDANILTRKYDLYRKKNYIKFISKYDKYIETCVYPIISCDLKIIDKLLINYGSSQNGKISMIVEKNKCEIRPKKLTDAEYYVIKSLYQKISSLCICEFELNGIDDKLPHSYPFYDKYCFKEYTLEYQNMNNSTYILSKKLIME